MRYPGNRIGLVGIFGLAGTIGAHQGPAGPDRALNLTVPVYDYASLDAASLQAAAQTAGRILASAGVRLELAACPMQALRDGEEFTCGRGPNSADLTLKILPGAMAGRLNRPSGEFGRSVAHDAYVFLDRIEEATKHDRNLRDLLLGHVLAHELGHLLLGYGNHSRRGIMKPVLADGDMLQIRQGTLAFHPAEAKRIRERLAKQLSTNRSARDLLPR